VNIAITGASGFLGTRLIAKLRLAGHTIRTISLRQPVAPEQLAGCEAVIHLAGEPVAQRWTSSARQRILGSRVEGTRSLIGALEKIDPRPSVLVSASAIGFYGSRGEEVLKEDSLPGTDFLAGVCLAWEAEARKAEKLGIRVVLPRIGLVMDPRGGALPRMLLPFRLGIGGRLGDGHQWMSWVHVQDLLELIGMTMEHPEIAGPVNAVAPNPVTNREFTRLLAGALHRPSIFPVPAFALRLLLGEMSQVVLASQRVMPETALRAGFQFRYSDLGSALAALFGSHSTSSTPRA